MAIANYGGSSYQFPDDYTDEQIYDAINNAVASNDFSQLQVANQPKQVQNEEGGFLRNALNSVGVSDEDIDQYGIYKQGQEGSIVNTTLARMKAGMDAWAAASDSSPYNQRKAQSSYLNSVVEQEKLGLAGNVISGIASYAPAIGLGIVNPLAGAGAASLLSQNDALLAQQEYGKELDLNKAAPAGIYSGVADLVSGGLASKALKALPTAKPLTKAGINTAEDVASNVAGNAFEKIAADQDWHEDIGTAAVVGAGAGAAVRGSLKGVNKALEFGINPAGQKAITDVGDLGNSDVGKGMNKDFLSQYPEYANALDGFQTKLNEAKTDSEIREAVDAINNWSEQNSHISGAVKMARLLQQGDVPVIDAFYNQTIKTRDGEVNLGEVLFGLSPDAMDKSRRTVDSSVPNLIGNSAQKEGITAESFLSNAANRGKKTLSTARGNLDKNKVLLENKLAELEMSGQQGTDTYKQLKRLSRSYNDFVKSVSEAEIGSTSTDTLYRAENNSRIITDLASRLGLKNDFVDVTGSKGSLDPLGDYKALLAIDSGLLAQDPGYRQSTHNVLKEKGRIGTLASGGLLHAPTNLAKAAGVLGVDQINRGRARRAIKRGSGRYTDLANMPKSLPEAAPVAKADLEANGINTGTLGETSTGMNPPAATTEVAPVPKEAPVLTEAPVSVSEKPKAKRVPLGGKKPEVAQKASESVTEPSEGEVPDAGLMADVELWGVWTRKQVPNKLRPTPKKSPKEVQAAKNKAARERYEKRKAQREKEQEELSQLEKQLEKVHKEAEKSREISATTIKTPKPKAEKAPEPEVETPTRKQSSKLRTPPKAVQKPVETPKVEEVATQPEVVETAPEATEAPKTSAIDMVRKPLEAEVQALENIPVKDRTLVTASKLETARNKLKEANTVIASAAQETRSDVGEVAKLVADMGGFDALLKAHKEAGPTDGGVKGFLKAKIRDSRAAQAEQLAKTIANNITTPEAPAKTAAQSQKDVDKAQAARDKAVDDYNKAVKLLEAGEYPQDIIDAAKAFAGGDKDLLNARAKKLMKDRVEEKNATKKQAEKDLSKAEREKARTDAEDARKQAAKEKADAEVADVSDLLELEGHNQADIAEAVARFPGNARAVQRAVLARTAARKKAEAAKAEEAAKKAEQAEQAAQAEQDKFTSRENVESYLEGQMVSDPEITTMLNRVFGHPSATHKPTPTVAQVNKLLNDIDAYLAREKAAYEKIHRDDPKQAKADNDRLFAIGNTQTNISNRVVPDDTGLKQAQTEARIAKEQRNKLVAEQKIADQQYKNAKEINDQVKDFREYLEAIGADDVYVAKMLEKHFSGRNAFKGAKPMSDVQYRKARLDAKAEIEAKVEKAVEKEAPKIKSQLEDQSDESLKQAVKTLLEISANRKNPTEFKAVVEGVKEEMSSRGMRDEVKILEKMQSIMDDVTEAKAEYPGEENRSLWLSRDDFVALQEMFNKGVGNAWMGNLGVQLRLFAFGDNNVEAHLSKSKIAERKAQIQQERFEKSELSDNGEIKMTKPKDEGNGPDDEGPKPPSGPKGGKPGVAPKPKSEAKTAPVVEATPSEAPKGALELPDDVKVVEKSKPTNSTKISQLSTEQKKGLFSELVKGKDDNWLKIYGKKLKQLIQGDHFKDISAAKSYVKDIEEGRTPLYQLDKPIPFDESKYEGKESLKNLHRMENEENNAFRSRPVEEQRKIVELRSRNFYGELAGGKPEELNRSAYDALTSKASGVIRELAPKLVDQGYKLEAKFAEINNGFYKAYTLFADKHPLFTVVCKERGGNLHVEGDSNLTLLKDHDRKFFRENARDFGVGVDQQLDRARSLEAVEPSTEEKIISQLKKRDKLFDAKKFEEQNKNVEPYDFTTRYVSELNESINRGLSIFKGNKRLPKGWTWEPETLGDIKEGDKVVGKRATYSITGKNKDSNWYLYPILEDVGDLQEFHGKFQVIHGEGFPSADVTDWKHLIKFISDNDD